MTEDTSFSYDQIFEISSKQIIHFCKISSNNVVIMTDNKLIRFNLEDFMKIEEIILTISARDVYNVFIDPSGYHVIISMNSGQCFYLHKSFQKLKFMKEAKECCIECVGWNSKYSCEQSTFNILIGTKTGEIIETKLSQSSPNGIDGYWKTINVFETKVNGLAFDAYIDANNTTYFLIVATINNLYSYTFRFNSVVKSAPIFGPEFDKINLMQESTKCTTFPPDLNYSCLDLYYPKNSHFPMFLSWLIGSGVYCAQFNTKITESDSITALISPKLLKFSSMFQNSKPLSLANTEFHVILQYSDCLDIVCTLSDKSIHTMKAEDLCGEPIISLCKDETTQNILFYTQHNIYKINYSKETKNLWKRLLDMKNFEAAYKYCNTDEKLNYIKVKEANHIYLNKAYVAAARVYAQTQLSFEEVALKFVELPEDCTDRHKALLTYLLCFIENLKQKNNTNKTMLQCNQTTFDVICIWLLDLFFDQIYRECVINDLPVTNKNLQTALPEYRRFVELNDVLKSLRRNKELIYTKLKSYGDMNQMALFAEIINDKDMILDCLLDNGETKQALEILMKENSPRYHYRYAKQMLQCHPHEIIDLWIGLAPKLDFKILMSSLRNAPDEAAHRFLNHAIFQQMSELEDVHNYYITLCCRLSSSSNNSIASKSANATDYTNQLINYLHMQGHDIFLTKYDSQLALRTCTEYNNLQGSVFIHCLLGKHKEAVQLALEQKNVVLAKSTAAQFIGEEEVKKKLWLAIARFIITENMNIQEVCDLIRTQSVLKLEDILPFLPDTVKIDTFKDAICESLDYYNSHIENLKKDMKLSTSCSNKIREEINEVKQRSITVPANARCNYCNESLTIRPFCLFPCTHFFHIHCLEIVVFPMLTNDTLSNKLIDIKHKLMNSPNDADLRKSYYNLISNDCCYCGILSIENIDIPVIGKAEFDSEMQQWN